MDMRAAFQDTLTLAEERGMSDTLFPDNQGTDYLHLKSMLDRIEAAPNAFSPAKLGRWLGYAQGVLVAYNFATLDEVKDINRRHAD